MSDITNEFAVLLSDYQSFVKELKELHEKYHNKTKSNHFRMMEDFIEAKILRCGNKIKKIGTSKSIIYITGTFWEVNPNNSMRSQKRFSIYFINEIALADIELLLVYYVKDLIDFKASIIATGKPFVKHDK